MTTAKRDLGVDLLRAVCILYIVGYWHLIPYTEALPGYGNTFTEGLKYGSLATFVFISGFLLARAEVRLDLAGLKSFYVRRLLRIYPLYLIALPLLGLVGLASISQLIDGALLISMFNPPALPTLWFITMIMLFYGVAPWLIRAADRPAMGLALGLLVLGFLLGWNHFVGPIDLRPLIYWPVFVLGVLYQRQPGLRAWCEGNIRWLALALVPALWLIRGSNEWSLLGIAQVTPLCLLSPVVLLILAPLPARRLHAPTVEFLAYTGFGLYLFHRATFAVAIDWWFPTGGWYQVLYLAGLVMPLTILLAYLIQRAYDRAYAALLPR